jgi:hypothetical protein
MANDAGIAGRDGDPLSSEFLTLKNVWFFNSRVARPKRFELLTPRFVV